MMTLVLVHAFVGVRILSEHIRLALIHEHVIRDSVHLLIHVHERAIDLTNIGISEDDFSSDEDDSPTEE